jgi:hypothetical protein
MYKRTMYDAAGRAESTKMYRCSLEYGVCSYLPDALRTRNRGSVTRRSSRRSPGYRPEGVGYQLAYGVTTIRLTELWALSTAKYTPGTTFSVFVPEDNLVVSWPALSTSSV